MKKQAKEIMKKLVENGFDMTTKEFMKSTVYMTLELHHIKDCIDEKEYFKLMQLILDECSLNDLRQSGPDLVDLNDDFKDK